MAPGLNVERPHKILTLSAPGLGLLDTEGAALTLSAIGSLDFELGLFSSPVLPLVSSLGRVMTFYLRGGPRKMLWDGRSVDNIGWTLEGSPRLGLRVFTGSAAVESIGVDLVAAISFTYWFGSHFGFDFTVVAGADWDPFSQLYAHFLPDVRLTAGLAF